MSAFSLPMMDMMRRLRRQMEEKPKCPYCHEAMILGDGCYWCMNKRCAEQFYPSGNDEQPSTPLESGQKGTPSVKST